MAAAGGIERPTSAPTSSSSLPGVRPELGLRSSEPLPGSARRSGGAAQQSRIPTLHALRTSMAESLALHRSAPTLRPDVYVRIGEPADLSEIGRMTNRRPLRSEKVNWRAELWCAQPPRSTRRSACVRRSPACRECARHVPRRCASLMTSSAAICRFVNPPAISAATCCSRCVSGWGGDAGWPALVVPRCPVTSTASASAMASSDDSARPTAQVVLNAASPRAARTRSIPSATSAVVSGMGRVPDVS